MSASSRSGSTASAPSGDLTGPAEAFAMPPSAKGEPAGERGSWRQGGTSASGTAAPPDPLAPARGLVHRLRRLGNLPAPLLCVAAMCTVQLGIALSKPLFGPLGVAGATFLRLSFAGVILLALTRPRLRGRSLRDLGSVALLGAASGGMTLLFAGAVNRLPMGTAATIEFLGPLSVALAFSRRLGHLLWALLAGAGVALLTLLGSGSGPGSSGLDPVGLGYAFGAAACYAGYILLTDKVGAVFKGFEGLAVSISVGAVTLAPFGLMQAWHGLAGSSSPGVLLLSVAGVALLLPVIPYALEMTALRRVPQRVFSVILSLEPAVSALAGLLVLGQLLGGAQLLGIACVVVASAGSTLTGRRS